MFVDNVLHLKHLTVIAILHDPMFSHIDCALNALADAQMSTGHERAAD